MGYIKTFFNSFKDNTSNNINSIPDVAALPAKEWNVVSPEVKKILMESDKKTIPEFVKNLIEHLKGTRKRELKKASKEQSERDPEEVYGPAENYKGVFSDDKGKDRDER